MKKIKIVFILCIASVFVFSVYNMSTTNAEEFHTLVASGDYAPPIFPTAIPTSEPVYVNPVPTQKTTPTPTPVTAPSKPTKLSAKNNKKKIVTITWKKVKGAKGYQVQYAYSEPFSKKTKTTTKTKLVVKSLKKRKTYSFRVRAYKLDGKKKVYGKWSTVKKVKIKK